MRARKDRIVVEPEWKALLGRMAENHRKTQDQLIGILKETQALLRRSRRQGHGKGR